MNIIVNPIDKEKFIETYWTGTQQEEMYSQEDHHDMDVSLAEFVDHIQGMDGEEINDEYRWFVFIGHAVSISRLDIYINIIKAGAEYDIIHGYGDTSCFRSGLKVKILLKKVIIVQEDVY